jgi:hypothetical protein
LSNTFKSEVPVDCLILVSRVGSLLSPVVSKLRIKVKKEVSCFVEILLFLNESPSQPGNCKLNIRVYRCENYKVLQVSSRCIFFAEITNISTPFKITEITGGI